MNKNSGGEINEVGRERGYKSAVEECLIAVAHLDRDKVSAVGRPTRGYKDFADFLREVKGAKESACEEFYE